ncbi:hypothetical protein EMCG_00065 [[Emmonsia] crescens]|uniref:Uncharacterized protein n=1 Tax=[Emmonsia] crescens TaxID=73230 RepID=A0A0G2J7Z9_9EURO|nr:hypothetical protein EMCG_00065 [Emmonsia crescens UAMH 3008]
MAGGQLLKRLIFQGSSAYTLLVDSPTEANLQLLSLPGLGQPAVAWYYPTTTKYASPGQKWQEILRQCNGVSQPK